MKKTLIAIALAAMMAPAWGAEVVSSNIVGYNKVTLNEGLNLIAAQFVPVGDPDGALTLEDMENISGQPGYSGVNAQTELRFWTGTGYDYYGWSGEFSTENLRVAQRMVQQGTIQNITDLDFKWLSGYNLADNVPVETTEGLWLYAKAGGSITISGEVPTTNSVVTVNLAPGLNMLSFPWPADCKLKSISVSGQPGYSGVNAQTEIRYWTGNGYEYYGWSGAFSEENLRVAQRMVQQGTISNITDLDYKWLSGYNDASDSVIPLGHGFWIYAKNAGSVTFTYGK